MTEERSHRTSLLADSSEPLVLVGPPSQVQGVFRVQNTTEKKVVVKEPLLRTAALSAQPRGRRLQATSLPHAGIALRRIVVRAGRTHPVPVVLALDPSTPPGTYHASLDVGGEERPVVVHVTEHVSAQMAPSDLVLPNHPREKVQKQVVFTNLGNLPFTVRSIGTVVLDDELSHCRALRGALADVGDTMKHLDDFVVALGRRYRAVYENLVLKVQNERVVVGPGETRAIALTITLPEKLDARTRYSGYAPISTGNLTFTIVPD